jgi:competence protein ComEC
LEAPPVFDGFSYQAFLARSGLHSQVQARQIIFLAERQGNPAAQAIFGVRAHALATVRALWPQPHAELLAGILLGLESGIPDDVQAAFNATGTSHLIAISGFNIAILAGVITTVTFRLWGRWRGTLVTIALLAVYTLLAGASGSVVRAALMGSLTLIGQQVGRRALALNTLAATVCVMTAIDPNWLWDSGFQLSTLATLGLVLYATPWQDGLQRALGRVTTAARARRLAGLLGESVLVTVAAQATTLPLILLFSQRFSLSALPANLLVLPAQPALMMVSGLAVLLGMVWQPLGQLAAWLAWPFSAYTLSVVEFFAAVPGGSFFLSEVAPALMAASYALLFGATWLAAQPARRRPAWWQQGIAPRLPAGGLVMLFGSAMLVWGYYFSLPANAARLRVTVLAVGEGEAVLIQTPSGGTALIGGGAGGRTLTRALGDNLPLGTTVLNLLVIAAPDEEHLGGVPDLLERYAVQRAVLTGAPGNSAAYRAALEKLYAEPGLALTNASELPTVELGEGVSLRVVADGEHGSTLSLDWERFSLLLPIGLEAEAEQALAARGLALPATALLLGRAGAVGEAWMLALDPRLVLVSTAAGSDFPDAETAAALAGRTVLRTDLHGSVTVETDGVRLWVEVER